MAAVGLGQRFAELIGRLEEEAGQADTMELLYWELRGVLDDIRVRLNVADNVSDRAMVALIPTVPRQVTVVLPVGVTLVPGSSGELRAELN